MGGDKEDTSAPPEGYRIRSDSESWHESRCNRPHTLWDACEVVVPLPPRFLQLLATLYARSLGLMHVKKSVRVGGGGW